MGRDEGLKAQWKKGKTFCPTHKSGQREDPTLVGSNTKILLLNTLHVKKRAKKKIHIKI